MKKRFTLWFTLLFSLETVVPFPVLESLRSAKANAREPVALTQVYTAPGQSLTQLADGRWLVLGGTGPTGPQPFAALWDPQTQQSTVLVPNRARAWHSATVLPTGQVLVFGGVGANGEVMAEAELFEPETQTFTPLVTPLTPRAHHSATLLTDGEVLVVGGISAQRQTLNTSELWDFRTPQSAIGTPQSLLTARRKHTAVLLPSGEVLVWEGEDHTGTPLSGGEWYDPVTHTWTALATARTVVAAGDQPHVVASVPTEGTTDAPLESLIALRFSQPLRVESVNPQTITLSDQTGFVSGTVIAAEGGMLAFLLPQVPLHPAMAYTIAVDGPQSETGSLVPLTYLHFSTGTVTAATAASGRAVQERTSRAVQDPEDDFTSDDWVPTEKAKRGDWRSHRPDPDVRSLPPLQAGDGITALAGQVLSLGGKALVGVRLQIAEQQATTDDTVGDETE